jgi:hypothetical protein
MDEEVATRFQYKPKDWRSPRFGDGSNTDRLGGQAGAIFPIRSGVLPSIATSYSQAFFGKLGGEALSAP